MGDVTLLPGGSVPGENVSTDVVAALEEALGEARSGKLVGVAIAKVYVVGDKADVGHSWAWGLDFQTSRLVGCLSALSLDLAHRMLNGRNLAED